MDATYLSALPEQYRSATPTSPRRLDQLRLDSLQMIGDVVEVYHPDVAIAMSWGKDSVTLLSLVRRLYPHLTLRLLFTDTGRKFPETYGYAVMIQQYFAPVEVHTFRPKTPLETCDACREWKVRAAVEAPKQFGLRALLVGTRADEHEARDDGRYAREVEGVHRLHPILDWTEADVWEHLREWGIPTHPLYDEGYRSIGCASPCTMRTPVGLGERAGRAQDKEDAMAMLRGEGYW